MTAGRRTLPLSARLRFGLDASGRLGLVLVQLPEPYDFALSTGRFRAFGLDRANLWHEGGLHRVVAGREVRIEAAPGGVDVEPHDSRRSSARCCSCSARRSTSTASPPGPPVTRCSPGSRRARRLPSAARAGPVRGARDGDHRAAGLAPVGRRDPQQADRALRHSGAFAFAFPTRERVARASVDELFGLGFSWRKAEYVSTSPAPTSTCTRSQRSRTTR